MSNITNCPNCQTQFIVTNDQLNQHNGKVRCGQCLHVFDANKELVNFSEPETQLTEDTVLPDINSVKPGEVLDSEQQDSPLVSEDTETEPINARQDSQANYFETINDKSKSKSRLSKWVLSVLAVILVIAAVAQSFYHWRSDIATYYPELKPLLTKLCEKLSCSIQLPKKIELIIIDDSDMQEDDASKGLIHFSTTLINQAAYSQTYPNIELTLTDTDDKPKLRRIFNPTEYLPEHTDISRGLPAGAEIKVKLALTTQDETVAGYRLAVSF